MDIYEYTTSDGTKRFVRASEDDGQFSTDDVKPGVARRHEGFVAILGSSIEELVARGARTYTTPFQAGAAEYRATVSGRGAAAELTKDDAVERVREWLTEVVGDAVARGHGVPVGASGQIDRRMLGGAWVPWRTMRVRQERGEETWSIVRADR
jgi:hypothetical protein